MSWIQIIAVADVQRSQFLAVAGFVMLGWILARRTLKMRKRVNADTRAATKELKKIRNSKAPVLPLSDAPPETQRWQVALFETQRELKAELDTRIVIVQTLLRQVDAKVRRLSELQNLPHSGSVTNPVGERRGDVDAMVMNGHTAQEIASALRLPLEDVELTIATTRVG